LFYFYLTNLYLFLVYRYYYLMLCFTFLFLDGVELFRDFLKSEFSEENIEFWIICEEFKSIRTNKLVAQAHRIYSDFIAIKATKQVGDGNV